MAEAVRPRKPKHKSGSSTRGTKDKEKKKPLINVEKNERATVQFAEDLLKETKDLTTQTLMEEQIISEFTEIQLNDADDSANASEICDVPKISFPLPDGVDAAGKEDITEAGLTESSGSPARGLPEPDAAVPLLETLDSEQDQLSICTESVHRPQQHTVAADVLDDASTLTSQSPPGLLSEVLELRTPQHCYAGNELFVHSVVKPLYPELPAEFVDEKEAILATKPLMHYERLYPEISPQPEQAPFTKEQLKLIEPCSWLENVDSYVEDFEHIARQDRHDFHELLMNYWRCRKQLLLAETELRSVIADLESVTSRLWTFKEEHLTLQGICSDQAKVTGYHHYKKVEMDEPLLGETKRLMEIKCEQLHQTLALHSYTSVLSRLQAESYIYGMLNSSPLLRSVAIQKPQGPQRQDSIYSDQSHLKECISVLFGFTRRVIEDVQFRNDILLWLQKLVSVLHKVGSPGDHIFLLNHILRCPAGVKDWAIPFVQIKLLNGTSGIFHFMQSLALLMSPVKNRDDFLCHMKPSEKKSSSTGPESGNWMLVDEGGEEDEDPETSWILLSEDDLIALLSQFPFCKLFKRLLRFNGQGDYVPEKTTSQEMMKIFAFANSLVEVLAVGLETFNRARYRQFVKRIGQIIRMTLCYVSDHWAQYICNSKDGGKNMPLYSLEKLQLEYDELFLRAVLEVLKAKRLGIWLFMSEMPYGTLSNSMLWKLFFVMHCAESQHLDNSCSIADPEDCKSKLRYPDQKEAFQTYLSAMNSSEGICLLTTFAQMAQAKRADVDENFIKDIALEIFEVSYVNLNTREMFSKVGRELLAAITGVHTWINSVLLERIRETIAMVGMVSLYLFKELPLYHWIPSSSEIAVIRNWLLNHGLADVENKLACIILEGLNWGYSKQGTLHLDSGVHMEVALLVLEAYQKYITEKPYGGLISESIKQVSYLASVVRLGQTAESAFNQWAWDLVLRLKLHRNDHFVHHHPHPASVSSTAPDLTESTTVHPLIKAVRAGIPIGCYLALASTTLGHSIDTFCAEGIPLLGVLVQSRHLRAVVHVLDKVLPLFYPCQYYLLKNDQFLAYIRQFLQLDSGIAQGVTQQVTQKVTQHFTGMSYGENLKLLDSMIQTHVSTSSLPNHVGPVAVLDFWVQLLTSQPLWHRERTTLYLMDQICKAAFRNMQEDSVQKILYQQHKTALGYHSDKGLLSSLVSWMVAGNITPSFIEGHSSPSQVWFAWAILNMESVFEEDSQLRRVMEWELLSNPSITPDQALKKAQNQLKLPIAPSLQRLMIYRWAHQALVTPVDHPILPLLWQKFFLLYLHRPGPQYGLPVEGCIGRRFFCNQAHLNLLKEMKKRLTEIADFHHAASKAYQTEVSVAVGSNEQEHQTSVYSTSLEMHKELVRLFNVLTVWLEDENFQKGDVYVPSLTKKYDPHRLAKVMLNDQDLWMECVNIEQLHYEFQEAVNIWTEVKSDLENLSSTSASSTDFTDPFEAKNRVLSNLKSHDGPSSGPPLQLTKAPVPRISSTVVLDQQKASQLMRKDLTTLQKHARMAALWESQQVALDNEMLDTMPKLYMNREEQISMELECRGSSNKICQGPALVTAKFEGMHMNETIHQQLKNLEREIKQLQTEAARPPPLNVVESAVHAENFITALVNAFKLQPASGTRKVGIMSFFTIVEFVTEETQRHPPTRQFFTSCIEILGQVFISGTKSECKPLLETILRNRRLCNLLSPFFTPIASPHEFVNLYETVAKNLAEDNSDVIFMLLTKFDLSHWLTSSRPSMSERTRLLESIHVALTACGLEPEEEISMPCHIFCKHWTTVLLYQFPDHYSDFLRLLMQSSADQLISPDCWKASLRALGCYPPRKNNNPKESNNLESGVHQSSANKVLLSTEQVMETMEWLSDFFYKLRLGRLDFRSFGLLSKWSPYMEHMKNFIDYLVKNHINSLVARLAHEPIASGKILTELKATHSIITELFKPWIFVVDTDDKSNQRCYPWLESDTSSALMMVELFTECLNVIHQQFKEKVLPGQRGILWLHLIHYCESCAAPTMPEFILYTYHHEYGKLSWKEMHPDQALMEEFFKVERGSPKSCFLFLGSVLCRVNWVSVLSDIWNPMPLPETHKMINCLLYMMVFLAKEQQLITEPESPLLYLLGQASSLSWQHVDVVSYQNIINYFGSHYPPSTILATDTPAELVVKLLKDSAGFGAPPETKVYFDVTPKCRLYIHQVVLFLSSLEQTGKMSLSVLEEEMSKLLDDIVIYNPLELDIQKRHMVLSSLFTEVLMMMNNASVTTAELLRGSMKNWIGRKVCGMQVMPLLTAACQSLASVRHMAETTEACIMAYFRDESFLCHGPGWGPILASLQVPELSADDFFLECMSLGSYLTLYVYVLQSLNKEQTLTNEMRVLQTITKWLEQATPSSSVEEAKLFLWWHKALQLSLIQMVHSDGVLVETVIRLLLTIQGRQSQLGEERLTSGILGAIGLGRKSPLSNRFRVVARSMSAYLLVQVPGEKQVRLTPSSALQLSPKAQQALTALEAMASNKQYTEYQEVLSKATQFIKYPGHSLEDGTNLLALLINALYPEVHYVNIIR
ncbi:ectopic P granules protein 5 homolog [Ambystoma mexicanum]|uniref:ectopic P granules protein 5 homolog n=1 Tax=Ambystoma mexicanum TaxID=8296 RepID=UPI0037E82D8D